MVGEDVDMASNLKKVRERIARAANRAGRSPDEVTLVVVSKTIDMARIREAVKLGVTHVGENRVQEAQSKIEALTAEGLRPTWHMVGHLQTNKAKDAVRLFDIIQSVDSLHLAETLSLLATRIIPILVEVNVAGEATKEGFRLQEVSEAVEKIRTLPNLEVLGLMTVAPLVADPEEVRPVFRSLRQSGQGLGLRHLSMGMTDDFEVAIEEGATIVRIGRAIFGERKEDK
ncbi:MAG: YggS family pyridoxal phosphate-dependent enzyme [Dehalococcoidia bacterium]|nr:YggS family pyridoxal phosphate-dependent enzyme [Dehalococcoidia bacterium]